MFLILKESNLKFYFSVSLVESISDSSSDLDISDVEEDDSNEKANAVESPEYAGRIEATSTTLQSFANIGNNNVEMSQSFVECSQEASQEVSSMASSDVLIEESDKTEGIKESGFLSSQESSQETKTVSAVSESEVEDASGKTFLTQQMAESKLDDENVEASITESRIIDSSKTESGMVTGDDEDMDLKISDEEIEKPETHTEKFLRATSISKDTVGSPVAKRLLRGSSVPKTIPPPVELTTPNRIRSRRRSQLDKIEEDSPLPSPAKNLRSQKRFDSQDSDSGNLSTPSTSQKRIRTDSEPPQTPTRMTRRRSSQLEDPPSTPSRSTRGKSVDVESHMTPRKLTRRSVARDSPEDEEKSTPSRNLRRSMARDSPENESTPRRNLRKSVARDSPEKEHGGTPLRSLRSSVARDTPERGNAGTPVKALRRNSTVRDTPDRTTRKTSVSRESPEKERNIRGASQIKEMSPPQKPEASKQTRDRTKSTETSPKSEDTTLTAARRMTRTQKAKAAEMEARIKGVQKRTRKVLEKHVDLGDDDLSDAESTSSKMSLRSTASTRKSTRRTKKVSFQKVHNFS